MFFIGIDIGSLTTKAVLLKNGEIVDFLIERSTYNFQDSGKEIFCKIIQKNNLQKEQIQKIMLTGYGRHSNLKLNEEKITEISAHARGVQYYFPKAKTIIDIGGQDSKVIIISKKSKNVLDFQMNDKCAAGTGRFLEVMAKALQVPIEQFGELSLKSDNPENISSMCTVFAESEIIGLFARGAKKEDIAAGLHQSIAKRVGNMALRLDCQKPLIFCGGVAHNSAVQKALEEKLNMKIKIPPQPELTGALGAALIAWEKETG
ncbi:acyl-CoA dehydratase activase [Candidatus Lokiarchaeum ossiferum]|uniref:acyl-CoA dehydratase activase n=1 Tax=Candidatus Lokiarchaeum ossiferum TaxID=2951803 RepID=UPI00352EF492